MYIYIRAPVSYCLILKRRGRKYERSLSEEYLNKIHLGYFDFIKNNPPSRFKIIDISERDFVVNHQDYLWVLSQIQ